MAVCIFCTPAYGIVLAELCMLQAELLADWPVTGYEWGHPVVSVLWGFEQDLSKRQKMQLRTQGSVIGDAVSTPTG